ncbi:MAG: 50S ribosomal protein L25 [Phycisphaerales bacterium]|jgi:large subunit ribosomal protein L25|nr:50S ribosomal protein L25 [Phycisphaerales bacterium]
MSNKTPIVQVELRDRLGKRYARRLRNNGRLPATIYGKNTEPVSVSVNEKEIVTQLEGGNHVIELDNGDGSPATVLVKDLQFGYLGDNLIHIDFARVNLKQVVTVTMTLDITGQPHAASGTGAVLEIPRPQIEIECMVQDIPNSIKVDLTTVEEVFTVGDLDLPEGVKATLDAERHIAHVTFVKEEIEEVETIAEGDEETTPEVISDTPEPTSEESSEESDSN